MSEILGFGPGQKQRIRGQYRTPSLHTFFLVVFLQNQQFSGSLEAP